MAQKGRQSLNSMRKTTKPPVKKSLSAEKPPRAKALQAIFETIGPDSAGQRLDNYLLRWAKGVPKSHVYRIIRSGEVRINKKRVLPSSRLTEGDIVRLPPTRLAEPSKTGHGISPIKASQLAADIPILLEDEYLLVIDKPSGMAVHGGSGVSLGAIELLRKARPESKFLELVHRLDRDTSGILIFAKKRSALLEMHRQIREGLTDKRYRLLSHGVINIAGTKQLKYPLLKYLLENGERRVRVDPKGQDSHTNLRVTEIFEKEDAKFTLAELNSRLVEPIKFGCTYKKWDIRLWGIPNTVWNLKIAVKCQATVSPCPSCSFSASQNSEKIRIEALCQNVFMIS